MKTLQNLPVADEGSWLVETQSGSRYVFDFDKSQLLERDDSGRRIVHDIDWIEQRPSINSRFRVHYGDSRRITSSPVVRILPAEADPFETDAPPLTELEKAALAPPRNAWLLMGDDASFPSATELRAQHHPTDPELPLWTSPKQIQRGDLVFMYFISPKKAVHFVGRATGGAVFVPDMTINAKRKVDPRQWWTELTPLVEVPPIPFGVINELQGGHMNLRGKPTHYLTPRVVEGLIDHVGRLDDHQTLVLQRPTGNPELPAEPGRMGIQQLRDVASGALILEATVEQYVVEPLLRLAFPAGSGYSFKRQHKISGAGVADYGIFRDGTLVGVVEAKLGVRMGPGGSLAKSPDLAQLRRYCEASGVPGLLVDANFIHLADRVGNPVRSLERSLLTKAELASLADDLEMLLNKDRRKSV